MAGTLERLTHKAKRLLENVNDQLRQYEFRQAEKKACKQYGRSIVSRYLNKFAGENADSLFDVISGRNPRPTKN